MGARRWRGHRVCVIGTAASTGGRARWNWLLGPPLVGRSPLWWHPGRHVSAASPRTHGPRWMWTRHMHAPSWFWFGITAESRRAVATSPATRSRWHGPRRATTGAAHVVTFVVRIGNTQKQGPRPRPRPLGPARPTKPIVSSVCACHCPLPCRARRPIERGRCNVCVLHVAGRRASRHTMTRPGGGAWRRQEAARFVARPAGLDVW